MSKNRVKTNLFHITNGIKQEVSREKKTGKLFLKNTDTEVSPKKVNKEKIKIYNFEKPYIAQDLGDEWSDYAWSANDF